MPAPHPTSLRSVGACDWLRVCADERARACPCVHTREMDGCHACMHACSAYSAVRAAPHREGRGCRRARPVLGAPPRASAAARRELLHASRLAHAGRGRLGPQAAADVVRRGRALFGLNGKSAGGAVSAGGTRRMSAQCSARTLATSAGRKTAGGCVRPTAGRHSFRHPRQAAAPHAADGMRRSVQPAAQRGPALPADARARCATQGRAEPRRKGSKLRAVVHVAGASVSRALCRPGDTRLDQLRRRCTQPSPSH